MAKLKAAFYMRVSTEDQLGGSGLETQEQECSRFATLKGYEVVERYCDEGISGAHGIEFRHGLERALADAKSGKFQVLVVYTWDRLGRDLPVTLGIVSQLVQSGVQLQEARSGQPFEGSGALVGLFNMWGSADERRKILEKTKHGHIKRARSGKVAGPAPFGYDKTADDKLVINEEEAAHVRQVFDWYLNQGLGIEAIAARLNDMEVKTKRAKANATGKNKYRGAESWQRSTVLCILRNPVYKGEYVYGKTHGKVKAGQDYKPNPKRPVTSKHVKSALNNREFLPHVVVPVTVPAIVEPDVWERAIALRAERANSGPIKRLREGAVYSYDFQGIVACAHCSRVLIRSTTKQPARKDGTRNTVAYYVCRNKEHRCTGYNKYHRMDTVNRLIKANVIRYLENPELTREGLHEVIKAKQERHGQLSSQLKRVESDIKAVQAKLKKVQDGYIDGVFTKDEAAARRRDFDAEVDRCEQQAAELKGQVAELGFEDDRQYLEHVVAYFESLKEVADPALKVMYGLMLDGDAGEQGAPGELTSLAQSLVKRVTLDKEGEIVDFVLRVPAEVPKDGLLTKSQRNYKAKRNSMTSPSRTTYSLPSIRTSPFSRAATFEPHSTRSL